MGGVRDEDLVLSADRVRNTQTSSAGLGDCDAMALGDPRNDGRNLVP